MKNVNLLGIDGEYGIHIHLHLHKDESAECKVEVAPNSQIDELRNTITQLRLELFDLSDGVYS